MHVRSIAESVAVLTVFKKNYFLWLQDFNHCFPVAEKDKEKEKRRRSGIPVFTLKSPLPHAASAD
jgi:hypothetical protein